MAALVRVKAPAVIRTPPASPGVVSVHVGGGSEPVYLPSADPEREPHRIVYREDYFASALHEVASAGNRDSGKDPDDRHDGQEFDERESHPARAHANASAARTHHVVRVPSGSRHQYRLHSL